MECADFQSIAAWSGIAVSDWSNWKWQLRNGLRSAKELNAVLATFTSHRVADIETNASRRIDQERLPFKVTPYMVVALKQALDRGTARAWEAFLNSFVPVGSEAMQADSVSGEVDGVGEELPVSNPVRAISKFYKDRALFRVTTMCPAYCRYCFRRRLLSDEGSWDQELIDEGLQYLREDESVRDVILSGGDPLVLPDSHLDRLRKAITQIPHVRRLRVDTKVLTMMPQRITEGLLGALRSDKPFYMVGHFSHVSELQAETRAACGRIIDSGIPLLAHTPLLRGVNDNEEDLIQLMEELVDLRIRPYYLIQFIPTKWTEHFRVPIARALELLRSIYKNCTGLAWPTYIVYLPDGGGKVPIGPPYLVEQTREGYVLEAVDGRRVLYREDAPDTD